MVELRFEIIAVAPLLLRKALTIGVRYAVCRRQFNTEVGSRQERKLMDYQTHMFKFSPILADTYVMSVVATELNILMNNMHKEISNN